MLDISSIISLFTNIEPSRACSASKLDGCLSLNLFWRDLISFT